MSAWLLVPAIVASCVATALRERSALRYWGAALGVSLSCALGAALLIRAPGPPGNSPATLAIAFVLVPMMLTFLVERITLRRARPERAALLGLPLGLASFAAALLVAMIVSVDAGVLAP